MSKKISSKIKVIDSENLIFQLSEDAQKGDYFSLKDLTEIDFSQIVLQIRSDVQNLKDKYIREKIESEKNNWIREFQLSPQFKEKEARYQQIETELVIAKNQIKNVQENKEKEIRFNIEQATNRLRTEIEVLKKEKETDKEIFESKKREEIYILKSGYDNQIEKLKREKVSNIKIYGTELENWIDSEYQNTFGLLEDCLFIKTTKTVEGTKPDFLFTVFSNDRKIRLGSVTIEAKTQFVGTEDEGRKNSSFYNALEKNRVGNKSEFSLLITELEPNDNFLIKKNNDENYKNMFICRPAYFIVFLSMIRMLYKKQEELNNFEAINFEEKQKILADFEEMKDNILNTTVKNIERQLEKILVENEKIKKSSEVISEAIRVIINNHMDALKNKIENFKIQKISKQIEFK